MRLELHHTLVFKRYFHFGIWLSNQDQNKHITTQEDPVAACSGFTLNLSAYSPGNPGFCWFSLLVDPGDPVWLPWASSSGQRPRSCSPTCSSCCEVSEKRGWGSLQGKTQDFSNKNTLDEPWQNTYEMRDWWQRRPSIQYLELSCCISVSSERASFPLSPGYSIGPVDAMQSFLMQLQYISFYTYLHMQTHM